MSVEDMQDQPAKKTYEGKRSLYSDNFNFEIYDNKSLRRTNFEVPHTFSTRRLCNWKGAFVQCLGRVPRNTKISSRVVKL